MLHCYQLILLMYNTLKLYGYVFIQNGVDYLKLICELKNTAGKILNQSAYVKFNCFYNPYSRCVQSVQLKFFR